MRFSIFGLAGLLFAGVAIPPSSDDLASSYKSLQEAVAKKDAAEVKKLAVTTCAMAREEAALAEPEGEAEKALWKSRVAYARDVEGYTEYALYATALTAPAETSVDLLATLEQQSPKSKYLDAGYAHYFYALSQTGGAAKIPAIAEKALANFPNNEDLLLVLADSALSRQQMDRAGGYAERLLTALARHPTPEGIAASDWEKKRTAALTRGYWIAGLAHSGRNEYAGADKDLRAALPLVQGNKDMLAAALFNLGVANYHLGRQGMSRAQILEGAKFSEQASAIPGPFQRQSWTNAHLMKAEAEKMFVRK